MSTQLYNKLVSDILPNTIGEVASLYARAPIYDYLKPFITGDYAYSKSDTDTIEIKIPLLPFIEHDMYKNYVKCIGLFRVLLTINVYNHLKVKPDILNVKLFLTKPSISTVIFNKLSITCNVENIYWRFYNFYSDTNLQNKLKQIEKFNYKYRKYHKETNNTPEALKEIRDLFTNINNDNVDEEPLSLPLPLPVLKTRVNYIKKNLLNSTSVNQSLVPYEPTHEYLLIETVNNMLQLNNLITKGDDLKNYDFIKYVKRFLNLIKHERIEVIGIEEKVKESENRIKKSKDTIKESEERLQAYKDIIALLFDDNDFVEKFIDSSIYSNTNSFHRPVFLKGGNKSILKQYALSL
jgi:hypothetical protein